jgi:hypothetical protein
MDAESILNMSNIQRRNSIIPFPYHSHIYIFKQMKFKCTIALALALFNTLVAPTSFPYSSELAGDIKFGHEGTVKT